MIELDDVYFMAWDFVEERYDVNFDTCRDYCLKEELEGLALQCENIFDAIGSCENEKTFQSVMTLLCKTWESGRAYEKGKKEDEFDAFRETLDMILDKWEQGELKELKEIKFEQFLLANGRGRNTPIGAKNYITPKKKSQANSKKFSENILFLKRSCYENIFSNIEKSIDKAAKTWYYT